jgi:hypothetical protein
VNYLNILVLILIVGGVSHPAVAQLAPEYLEPTPEELDAAHSAADAARDAALWSNKIIDRAQTDPLGSLAGSADLIIHGKVESQSYSYDDMGIPFTHTTIAVTSVLRGELADTLYTLVQEGGPSRENPKRAMMVSSSKHFNVGEEELLFLKLNTGVPSANSANRQHLEPPRTGPKTVTVQNRFRIHEGKVYGEDGHGVIVESLRGGRGYSLRYTRTRNTAPRFTKIHIGDITLQKRFQNDDENAPDSADSAAPLVTGERSAAADLSQTASLGTFSAAITQ